MKRQGFLAATVALGLYFACAQSVPRLTGKQPAALKDLVSPGDPLASQDLRFDSTSAAESLEYLKSGDVALLEQISRSTAVAHLLGHARNFDYDVPKDSPLDLVSHFLSPRNIQAMHAAECRQNIEYFSGPMLQDLHWVNDTLRYLPTDFRFHGTLFLTFGYDIGVAFGPTASLNCAHRHFQEHPRELLYYAIHELHHVGFMAYQPPPKLADVKTCADLRHLVEYSTQLEGMAVLAAYERRREEHALTDDDDYVALQDEARMQRDEVKYFEDYDYLLKRSNEPADANAWAVIDRMSSGERLWYRVGARMAKKIEQTSGRTALVDLIKQGPSAFNQAYRTLR